MRGQGAVVGWACWQPGAVGLIDSVGRKLVGLAQRRQRTTRAAGGGHLATPTDWALLCGAMGQPEDAAAMQRRTVNCATWPTGLGHGAAGRAAAPRRWRAR